MEQDWPTPTRTHAAGDGSWALRVLHTPIYVDALPDHDRDQVPDRTVEAVEGFARMVRSGLASPELDDWAAWVGWAPQAVVRLWLSRGLSGQTRGLAILVEALAAVESDDPEQVREGLHRGGHPAWDAVSDRLMARRDDGVFVALLDRTVADARSFVAWRASQAGRGDLVERLVRGVVEQHAEQIARLLQNVGLQPTGWTVTVAGRLVVVVEPSSERSDGGGVFEVDLAEERIEEVAGFRMSIITPENRSPYAESARENRRPWPNRD